MGGEGSAKRCEASKHRQVHPALLGGVRGRPCTLDESKKISLKRARPIVADCGRSNNGAATQRGYTEQNARRLETVANLRKQQPPPFCFFPPSLSLSLSFSLSFFLSFSSHSLPRRSLFQRSGATLHRGTPLPH